MKEVIRTKSPEEVKRELQRTWEHPHCFCTFTNGRIMCCQCGLSLHQHNKTTAGRAKEEV